MGFQSTSSQTPPGGIFKGALLGGGGRCCNSLGSGRVARSGGVSFRFCSTQQNQPLKSGTHQSESVQVTDRVWECVCGWNTSWAQCNGILRYLTESSMATRAIQALISCCPVLGVYAEVLHLYALCYGAPLSFESETESETWGFLNPAEHNNVTVTNRVQLCARGGWRSHL